MDAKRGLVSRRKFVKLYMFMELHGVMVACKINYREHDSPAFWNMMGTAPNGTGHAKRGMACPAGMACFARGSCQIAGKDAGDISQGKLQAGGFGPMAKMEQWNHGSPTEFEMCHKKSPTGNAFPRMGRFGSAACARLERVGTIQMVFGPYLLQSYCMNRTCCTGLPGAGCLPENGNYWHCGQGRCLTTHIIKARYGSQTHWDETSPDTEG